MQRISASCQYVCNVCVNVLWNIILTLDSWIPVLKAQLDGMVTLTPAGTAKTGAPDFVQVPGIASQDFEVGAVADFGRSRRL